ncbi:MAG TPA: hypothetical protein ENI11_06645 [Actinobacteria bacterium]|nr:hypothetical protein [Actinomycetota bacterium]
MGSQSPVINRAEIESTLCQIAEIEAVRVVCDRDNTIQELHVLATGTRAPRQIVRDIESLLMARFSLPVDHKKISIAQINTGPESVLRETGRLKVNDIAIKIKDQETTFDVSLVRQNRRETGSVKGASSKNERLRLAALATLEAASKFKESNSNISLDYLSILPAGSGNVALVCVTVMTRAGEEVHSGSAMVKGNEDDAVIKAALSAINRNMAIN